MRTEVMTAAVRRVAGDVLGIGEPILRRVPWLRNLNTSSPAPAVVPYRSRLETDAAVLFVPGFAWYMDPLFGRFPEALATVPELDDWDLYGLSYSTGPRPDFLVGWAADPSIDLIATFLRTLAMVPPLDRYKSLALIGHSMGGLIIQRALVDDQSFTRRVSHVMLFGTPSGGLRKARWGAVLKRQIEDMGEGGEFIRDLRSRWDERFGAARPFVFWTIAGDCDMFVPASSSLAPFPEDTRLVVPGNHIDIGLVTGPEQMSVQVAVRGLLGDAAPAGPWNSARVAVEQREFRRAVDQLRPHSDELDEHHLVELAVALDAIGDRDEAIRVLRASPNLGNDAKGVLAGRLKRNWLTDGRQESGAAALALYQECYDAASASDNHEQAYYHGVNVAFLALAYAHDRHRTAELAREVLGHCASASPGMWCSAAEGEARL